MALYCVWRVACCGPTSRLAAFRSRHRRYAVSGLLSRRLAGWPGLATLANTGVPDWAGWLAARPTSCESL